MKGKRQDVVIATKVRARMGPGANEVGLSRLHILQAAEASLKRLGTDYIDLYQIHRSDPETDIEETLIALTDLVRSGKVRYIGCSNMEAWELMQALGVSEQRGLEAFKCTQSYYSLVGRDLEQQTIPLIQDQGLGLLVWSPLAGGFLSGKFTREESPDDTRRSTFAFPPVNEEQGFDIVDVMRPIAEAHDASVAQIALAWLLHKDAVTSVIIGARRMDQLEDNFGSVDVTLSDDEVAQLDSEQDPVRVSRLDGCTRGRPEAGRAAGHRAAPTEGWGGEGGCGRGVATQTTILGRRPAPFIMQTLGDSSRDAPPDHAGVAFHPPILLVVFLVLGGTCQRQWDTLRVKSNFLCGEGCGGRIGTCQRQWDTLRD